MYLENGTYYTGEHSISFGNITIVSSYGAKIAQFRTDKNTWEDWHLIPSSRPAVANPPIATKYIEIPGSDGVLDLSAYLSGRPTYGQRKGSFAFIVDNDHLPWVTSQEIINNYLHGKRLKMRLDDDPRYYYEGRFEVGNWTSGADHSSININYTLDPFKYNINLYGSDYPALWDPFNFETDVDYYPDLGPEIVSQSQNIWSSYIINSGEYGFVPTVIWVSGNVTVSFGGVTKTLGSSGSAELGKSVLGENNLKYKGIGSFKVFWRGGSL